MQKEYLITNRLGAYSSSTYDLGNTRKYHGLLVVSNSNIERKVIVNRLDEKVEFRGRIEYLSTNIYKGNYINPSGHKWLRNFSLEDDPLFEYLIELIRIKKRIKLADRSNKVEIFYDIETKIPFFLTVKPLLTNRSFHALSKFENTDTLKVSGNYNEVSVDLDQESHLDITGNFSEFTENKDIFYNFEYPVERERGYDFLEDLFSIGDFTFNFGSGKHKINLRFSYHNNNDKQTQSNNLDSGILIGKPSKSNLDTFDLQNNELNEFLHFLDQKADDFIIINNKRKSIIAGYHWFEDWGRDTFISFRGLLLCRDNFNLSRNIILDWMKHIRNGLIPNRPGLKEYNSLDATLWFIVSIYYYWQETQDDKLIQSLMPQISNLLQNLILGTKYGIHTLKNGLLISTDNSKGLTWMDAVVNGQAVTPRTDAAVEIQMLWYNVLNIYKVFESKFNSSNDNYYINLILKNLKKTFNELFWVDKTQYLADSVKQNNRNIEIRPNPVIGMSLPFKLLTDNKAKLVLDKIQKKLLTKVGLKTLSPDSEKYIGEYKGGQEDRDRAYHNGTVWPWLLGFYLKSYLNVYGKTEVSKNYIKSKLLDFWREVQNQDLNYLPEVFSADTLEPNGCLSQAWNYATLIEVLYDLVN
ncbi:hypothetical protein GF362_02695 [Candidatus Dojkabacteria bacterium]|nr:hypothetical protein [Candidatus Dojkabacteria bacterium]